MRQRDRTEVKKLLSEVDRLDLKKHIARVWESLDEEERTFQMCFEELIKLFPEKKIVDDYIIVKDEWGDADQS
tara:strand:- start:260 stop:478 length:219 start_codon:yes stop_codon:yes gene_type:complete